MVSPPPQSSPLDGEDFVSGGVGTELAWEWGPQQVMFQGYDLYGLYEPRPRTLDVGALQRRRFTH
jgi:hypothetical protein